jgi:hypothetical protein
MIMGSSNTRMLFACTYKPRNEKLADPVNTFSDLPCYFVTCFCNIFGYENLKVGGSCFSLILVRSGIMIPNYAKSSKITYPSTTIVRRPCSLEFILSLPRKQKIAKIESIKYDNILTNIILIGYLYS